MPTGQGSAGPSKLPLAIRALPATTMSTPRRPQRSPSKASAATPRRSASHPPKNTHDQDDSPPVHQTPANAPAFRASAPPTSTTRFSIRTPGSQVLPDFRRSNLLSASVGRSGGGKGGGYGMAAPTHFTPHGRAAIRAMDSRRAAINDINTPGRNRRRSMRDQRETPRDVLRALSKTLAPKSQAISSTSSSSSPGEDPTLGKPRARRSRPGGARATSSSKKGRVVIPEEPDDSDDEFPIDRPRFSLPIDEDADSDGDLPRPPRSSGLEDLEDNYTMQSIEMPRRATLGLNQGRYSMRMSMGDLQSDDGGDGGFDSAFLPRINWDEDSGEPGGGDGDDATLERVDDEGGRRDTTLGGRISDFGAIDFTLNAGDQSTVMMAPQVESSPERDGFSPENEPFGFDDGALPLNEDMGEEGNPTLDFGGGDDDEDIEPSLVTAESVIARHVPRAITQGRVKKAGKKISRHGIEYPSLPSNVVKRLAQRFAGKTKISPDTLGAIMQASDWFFEQLGDDLRAYANHAKGRTTINESDMLALMRR